MQRQYPFIANAAGAATIFDPLTRAAITTLPFLGNTRKQKLMGVSASCDANAWDSRFTVLIGNSLPAYRAMHVCPNDVCNADEALGNDRIVNYFDLGGLEINEGDTITITFTTGTFLTGVLYVEDMEGTDPSIPTGNVVTLYNSATDHGAAAFAALAISTTKLENSRRYSVFKTECRPEGSAALSIQMTLFQCGARTLAIPMGTMVYSKVPFSFSGLEWNNGQVLHWGYAEAAEKASVILHLIESADRSLPSSPNASPINPATPTTTPGVLSIPSGGGGSLIQNARPLPVFLRR